MSSRTMHKLTSAAGSPVRAVPLPDGTRGSEPSNGLDASLSAKVVHDLRQPVHAVIMALAVVRAARAAGDWDRAVAVAERQARRAASLLDDLVAGVREQRHTFSIRGAVLDLRALVEETGQAFEPAVTQSGVTLVVSRASRPLLVWGDADRLGQVLTNFLGNALRFTPRGGSIVLAAERQGDSALLRVRDSGAGMSRTDLDQIFGSHAGTDHPGGFGLGLTIAREIVAAHGGTIEARSDGPGTGSEFRAMCPLLPGPRRSASSRKAR
jgi:signal transduction histidine kinase